MAGLAHINMHSCLTLRNKRSRALLGGEDTRSHADANHLVHHHMLFASPAQAALPHLPPSHAAASCAPQRVAGTARLSHTVLRHLAWVLSTLMCCCCSCFCLPHRFQNESHVELPCNEVPEPQASAMAHVLSSAARAWWTSLAADTSSFTKPTYYLGMGTWRVTNMLADGAHERTPGNITLLANGAAGFRAVGDRMCFRAKVRR